jgi:hypothetical protein
MIMEDELYKEVYRMLRQTGNNKVPQRGTYTDEDIVLTYLWAVLHDRPTYWACKKSNWPIWYRRRPLPTASTMSRRLRTELVQGLMKRLEQRLHNRFPANLCRWIDAKPLPISPCSKDKQAGFGPSAGSMAKGYKLYTIADRMQGFVVWTIRPMNHAECAVGHELIEKLNSKGYLVGDRAYDTNRLYDFAYSKSVQLVTPQGKKFAAGFGHRRHSPYRIKAMLFKDTPAGQALLASRDNIDRMYGQLTNLGFGLSPLPNWVRTQFRVEMWVRGKLIFYNLWRCRQHTNAG